MNDNFYKNEAGADSGGAPELLIGRPTVTGNNGAEVSKALVKTFEVASRPPPEWNRLPAPGARDWLTGLSRTSLNEAVARGDIKAITVRQPGAVRGLKLINIASVRAWLAKLDAEQNPSQENSRA